MSVDMNGAIAYAKKFVGRVPYDMGGPRDPEKGTADCSSFVYWSVVRGGGAKKWAYNYAPSTVTMPQWLIDNGFKLIADNKSWNMQKGDIVIWGEPGNSYGSAGHTGICLDSQNWIEETGYIMNVGIYNHDNRWVDNGGPYFQVFRYQGSTPSKQNKPSKPKTHNDSVRESPIKKNGSFQAKIEHMNEDSYGKLTISGWAGTGYGYGFIFLKDKATGKELVRAKSKAIVRNDVNKHLGVKQGLAYGLSAVFDMKKFAGKTVYVMFRRTNDPSGNTKGGCKDVEWIEFALTIPKR